MIRLTSTTKGMTVGTLVMPTVDSPYGVTTRKTKFMGKVTQVYPDEQPHIRVIGVTNGVHTAAEGTEFDVNPIYFRPLTDEEQKRFTDGEAVY